MTPHVGFESIAILEYDSQEGGSHGGVVGAELGPTVVGKEYMRSWSDWSEHSGWIGIGGREFSAAGKKFGSSIKPGTFDGGGFGNWMDGQLSVGFYLGAGAGGAGGYVSVSWSGCKP